MNKILIIGSTVVDIILYKNQKELWNLGGCAFNVCHVVHHLNIPYYFLSTVGTGRYGKYVQTELKNLNIDPHVYSNEENGCCFCYIDSQGERSFKAKHGAEYTFQPSALNKIHLNEYAYLYICGLEIEERDGLSLIRSLKPYKGTIFFAPGPQVTTLQTDRLEKLFSMHCILHLNKEEAFFLAKSNSIEQCAHILYEKTRNIVFITDGENGSYAYDGTLHFAKSTPCCIVNTNGAGDAHAGALLSALAYQISIERALQFANDIARAVVESSTTHVKSYEPFFII